MTYTPEDFRGRRRDPKWERDLTDWLRTIPEAERLRFILDLVPIHQIALQLANKTLSEPASYEVVLQLGLREADVSSIKYCLEVTIPRLGFRRFVRILREHAETKPQEVEKTLYWLPFFANTPGYSAESVAELREAIHAHHP